jgi:predicted DNA-binding transcriptional regulator AlpA
MQQILLINDVAQMLKVSPSTISRWSEESRKGSNHFPQPISIRGGKRRWLLSDIEEYLMAQSTATQIPAPARQQRHKTKAFQERQSATDRALERYRGKGNQ